MTCLAIGVITAQSGNILIASTPMGKSHLMNLKKIATEVERRGNSVMVSIEIPPARLSRSVRIISHKDAVGRSLPNATV